MVSSRVDPGYPLSNPCRSWVFSEDRWFLPENSFLSLCMSCLCSGFDLIPFSHIVLGLAGCGLVSLTFSKRFDRNLNLAWLLLWRISVDLHVAVPNPIEGLFCSEGACLHRFQKLDALWFNWLCLFEGGRFCYLETCGSFVFFMDNVKKFVAFMA